MGKNMNHIWTKQSKKKPPLEGAIKKTEHKLVHRYYDIHFDNVPCFNHVERKHRATCLRRHREFEAEMERQPEGTLHFALTGRHKETPRQHLSFLIAKYCITHHVSYSDFFQSLQQQGGESVLSTPNLIKQPENREDRAVVNLLALPDQTLWNMYVAVPETFRPAERPKPEPREVPVRKRKRGGRDAGKITIQRNASGELAATVEQVTWACCDNCGKWRRLFNTSNDELPASWVCSMHPDELTCDVPEDKMDDDEAWDNEVHGAIGSPSGEVGYPSRGPSSAASPLRQAYTAAEPPAPTTPVAQTPSAAALVSPPPAPGAPTKAVAQTTWYDEDDW